MVASITQGFEWLTCIFNMLWVMNEICYFIYRQEGNGKFYSDIIIQFDNLAITY